jgi:very-short-patch-repair endonuclease
MSNWSKGFVSMEGCAGFSFAYPTKPYEKKPMKKRKVKRAKPDAGTLLEIHLRELKLNFVREFKFYTERDWRADFLISPEGEIFAILVEIEGSVWTQGRHTRGAGFLADMEKYNTATMLGFRVLRFSTEQVETGKAKEFLKEWL